MKISHVFPKRTACATALAFILLTLAGWAQTVTYNTNYVIITAAGSSSQNGNYVYQSAVLSPYSTGCFTNLNGDGATVGTYSGSIIMGDYYHATSFPTAWATDAGSNPAPSGSYLLVTNQWLTGLTNYWTQPGDQVSLTAAGWDYGVPGISSNQVSAAINGSAVFTSPWCSGNGLAWHLTGNLQWDGTNLNGGILFTSGDTNAPLSSQLVQIPSFNPGTNTFGLILTSTNLTLSTASLTAQRSPTNDIPQHVYVPPTITYYPSNTWSLYAITNAMPEYGYWLGNSNGRALVSVWLSNGIPWIKQLQP